MSVRCVRGLQALVLSLSIGSSFAADRPPQLEQLIERAIAESPKLVAARERLNAERRRSVIDRALPDPQISVGAFLAPVETRVGPQRFRLGAKQALPRNGTRSLSETIAGHRADAAELRLRAAELELAYDLTRVYCERHYLAQAIALTAENIEVLRRFEQIALRRYTVDEASHPDLVRAQVEIGKLENRLAELRQRELPMIAELTALLGRPPGALAAPIGALPRGRLAIDRELLLAQLESQPALQAINAERAEADRQLDLERLGRRPSWNVGVAWIGVDDARVSGVPGSGDDAVLAEVGISLPLWGRAEREKVAARQDQSRALAAESQQAWLTLAARVESALFQHLDANRRADLYRDSLIPQVTEWLRTAVIAFSTGESDFLDLLDTQRSLIEFQLAEQRALADRAITMAELEALVGRQLPKDPS